MYLMFNKKYADCANKKAIPEFLLKPEISLDLFDGCTLPGLLNSSGFCQCD